MNSRLTVSRLRGRQSGRARARLRLGASVVAGLLSLTVVFGTGFGWYRYRQFNQDVVRLDVIGAAGPAPSGTPPRGQDENILLIGNDDRTGDTAAQLNEIGTQADGGSLATDTMLLLHVPADGSRATGISFPRDSYVAIPGHGTHKLNSAYQRGYNEVNGTLQQKQEAGGALLIRTLRQLTGLTVDHFASVNLYGFFTISNAIKGVPVNLCRAERPARYYGETGPGIDSGFEPDGSFVYSYTGIDLHQGVSVVQGKQALAFVRQRHGLTSDLDRIKRQQYFLTAAFRQITSAHVLLSPGRLSALLGAVDGTLQLDRHFDIPSFAAQLSRLSADHVVFRTIPTDGDVDTPEDGSALAVDPAEVRSFVATVAGVAPKPTAAATRPGSTAPRPTTSAPAPAPAPADASCVN